MTLSVFAKKGSLWLEPIHQKADMEGLREVLSAFSQKFKFDLESCDLEPSGAGKIKPCLYTKLNYSSLRFLYQKMGSSTLAEIPFGVLNFI